MREKQAMREGYTFSGAYSWDKEEIKAEAKAERKKGNKAVMVTVPPDKLSRGYHGDGYSVYWIESPENKKAKEILRAKKNVERLEKGLYEKELEVKGLEVQLAQARAELDDLLSCPRQIQESKTWQ